MNLCGCGCGLPTRQYKKNDRKRGCKRGEYARFRMGHYSRTEGHRVAMARIDPSRTRHAGPENAMWKGGRRIDAQGYVVVRVGVGRERREHRVVAETMLGRALCRGEVVHHKNGIRSDNRPENLEVLDSQSAHMKHHLTPDEARKRGRNGGWKRRAALRAVEAANVSA